MTSPTFLHELPEEQFKKISHHDIQKIQQAEQLYWANKPYTKFYAALTVHGQSAALVGSPLEDGDEIIDSPITSHFFRLYHDQLPPEGFMRETRWESKDV